MTKANKLSPKFDSEDKTLTTLRSLPEKDHPQSEELLLSYIPKVTTHVLSFARHGILKIGNISTIVGPSGFGKSSITESMISAALNPYVDTLGIKVEQLARPVLWIDGERTKDDIAFGFERIKRRILIESNPELIVGDRFKNIFCHPFITYPKRQQRVAELERLCKTLQPGLVVLDGAADFVRDVNDTAECVDFVALVISLANEFSFGVMATIHPNPGQQSDYKPRGVLGSELIRTSESMILLKRASDDRDVRILTMDFTHGKNRNQTDNLEHYFRWSDQHKMFTSCEYTPTVKPAKTEEMATAFEEVLSARKLTYKELQETLILANKCRSKSTAEKWIRKATDSEIIFNQNGIYGLSPF